MYNDIYIKMIIVLRNTYEQKQEEKKLSPQEELEQQKREDELLRAELKTELEILDGNRVFKKFLEFVENRRKSYFNLDRIKVDDPNKRVTDQFFYIKGVYEFAGRVQNFFKEIRDGKAQVRMWREDARGRDKRDPRKK